MNGKIHRKKGKKGSKRQLDPSIPSKIFRSKPLTVYEALVEFLRDKKGLSYHEIAVLLERDERDTRKVYFRAKEKRKK